MRVRGLLVSIALLAAPVRAAEPLSARAIIEQTFEAQGGAEWATVHTLVLSGDAIFYPRGTQESAVRATRYAMWRQMDENRTSAHGPDGRVRIDSFVGPTPMFQVAFDGTDTTTEKGVVPPLEADKYWASAFGFGIIRQALKPGFTLVRLPDDKVDGKPVYVVRIVDPAGQETLFGVDQKTFWIRRAGFMTPKGWHERVYDDFITLKNPRWVQARHIRLSYNGVINNEVFWRDVKINAVIDPAVFRIAPGAAK